MHLQREYLESHQSEGVEIILCIIKREEKKQHRKQNMRESSQDKIKCTSSEPQASLKIKSLGKNTK